MTPADEGSELTMTRTTNVRLPGMRTAIAAMVCGLLVLPAAAARAAQPAAAVAGSQACRECHEDLYARYERNVHAGAAAAQRLPERPGCEACHGAAAAHAADPSNTTGLVAFAAENAAAANAACDACHGEDAAVSGFVRSSHGRHRVGCFECHLSPHAAPAVELRRAPITGEESAASLGNHLKRYDAELCLACHQEQRGRFRMPFRHPVREKAISCAGCHNPHRDRRPFAGSVNATCLSCHEDRRGPWPFEHAPVAEDCASCHEPHGSVAPKLLRTAQPFICLTCHALPDDRHGEEIGGTQFSRAIYQRCTSCHGAIHGSHEDRHLKK
jgi:DmsE family decaheme c-type cytochrome